MDAATAALCNHEFEPRLGPCVTVSHDESCQHVGRAIWAMILGKRNFGSVPSADRIPTDNFFGLPRAFYTSLHHLLYLNASFRISDEITKWRMTSLD